MTSNTDTLRDFVASYADYDRSFKRSMRAYTDVCPICLKAYEGHFSRIVASERWDGVDYGITDGELRTNDNTEGGDNDWLLGYACGHCGTKIADPELTGYLLDADDNYSSIDKVISSDQHFRLVADATAYDFVKRHTIKRTFKAWDEVWDPRNAVHGTYVAKNLPLATGDTTIEPTYYEVAFMGKDANIVGLCTDGNLHLLDGFNVCPVSMTEVVYMPWHTWMRITCNPDGTWTGTGVSGKEYSTESGRTVLLYELASDWAIENGHYT